MGNQRLDEIIDANKNLFISVSDRIWEYAETRFQEYNSAELLCTVLENEGFSVKRGVADIATAFVGSFGDKGPVIAVLGEYDALSGLSQKCGIATKKPLVEGGNGHGCGHNLLGAGSLAAAIAVKRYLQEKNIAGTIRYYGCPGEEGGSGKAFMAREGLFSDVDAALTWHPLTHNAIYSVSTLANYQVYFKFHGKSSHAGMAPHLGRSALDAVELMNVGSNYLREHIIPGARIHYAVTNTGGISPNVVQSEGEVVYLIRAPKISQVQEIYERVCKIAKGAALMTETECEIIFDKACSDYMPNNTLEQFLYANFKEVGIPQLTEIEKNLARDMKQSLAVADISNDLKMASELMGGAGKEIINQLKEKDMSDVILPHVHMSMLLPGSTDVGDVSWIVPTAQLGVACNVFGTPGHSWQSVSQGATGLAHKGMLVAGKVMARTILDVLENPEIITKAKVELREKLNGATYVSPIPPEIKPAAAK